MRRYSLIVALTLMIVAAATLWLWTAKPPSNTGRAMVAVLPFANLTGDAGQRSFGEGMTEEIITDLGRLDPPHLGVIARSSILRYADTTKPIRDIGRDLGVAYVVEGSVRREAEKVLITAQLIRVRDESHIWAQSYDRESGATLALESDVATAIVREVTGRVAPDRRSPQLRARASDLEAYGLYFQGRESWNVVRRTACGRLLIAFRPLSRAILDTPLPLPDWPTHTPPPDMAITSRRRKPSRKHGRRPRKHWNSTRSRTRRWDM